MLWVVAALALVEVTAAAPAAHAATVKREPSARTVQPVPGGCPRPRMPGQITEPPALRSYGGTLAVQFSYQTDTDATGRTLYCFLTPEGLQNPTLRVRPGDTLTLTVTNNTPPGSKPMPINNSCGDPFMNTTSLNIHYHGTNTAPDCHGDEVIKTVINSGETFTYTIAFPQDQPPGLYWYHPHIHGLSDGYVTGGATGALIVDGIEQFFPALSGLTQRTLVVRDQSALVKGAEGPGNCGNGVPFRDVSVNAVPVNSYRLAVAPVFFLAGGITVPPQVSELWRIGNTSADTILDLQLIYDGVPQPLAVVAIDGVPVNSEDGMPPSDGPISVTNFRVPPASRVEFVVQTPPPGTRSAQLVTQNINTGAVGDCDPRRPLFAIDASAELKRGAERPASTTAPAVRRRFAGLAAAKVTQPPRILYFAENAEQTEFYMSVSPQPDRVFDPNMTPGIVTTAGAVETWIVQNRSTENHEFHIHQIHFLVQSQDNFGTGHPPAPGIVGQYLDTIEVPAWDGVSPTFPSVTLKMDFRGAVVGSFVFHCHILGHEDAGMMNIIQVLPSTADAAKAPIAQPAAARSAHRH